MSILSSLLGKKAVTVPSGSPEGSPIIPPKGSPHSPFAALSAAERTRIKHAIIDLRLQTDALTRKDIAAWRQAWQAAINVDYPDRSRLYDIYRDTDADLHLSGCIQQRTGFVLARSFKIVDAKGKENEQAAGFFNAPWFKQLIRYALEANYWGHSLIELGNLVTVPDGSPSGKLAYDSVRLIPRKHVIPEHHCYLPNLSLTWRQGIDYHERPFWDWLIEVGQPDDLGLFLKAAQQTIPKKNALSFWDAFAELFGMPMRIARTNSRSDKDLREMERMMDSMGTEAWGIFPMGTEIEVVESTRGDAFNVYDKRIDRANSELSKLIIGQTMTIEDGSSLSQSQTHLKVFENIVEADCDHLRDIINTQLIPRMVRHGFPLQGLHFDWDYSTDYTPEQQAAYEQMVLNEYEVDPSYFAEKYNMPVGNRRAHSPSLAAPTAPGDSVDRLPVQPPFFD